MGAGAEAGSKQPEGACQAAAVGDAVAVGLGAEVGADAVGDAAVGVGATSGVDGGADAVGPGEFVGGELNVEQLHVISATTKSAPTVACLLRVTSPL